MDKRVAVVLDAIDRSFEQHLTVNELAGMVGLSTVRLQHLFKKATGNSIRHYVIDKRLDAAVALLEESPFSIKEICHRVGFTDSSDFYRTFKKRFKTGPSDYRDHVAKSTASRESEDRER